jgi:hypothetical protein
LPGSFAVAHKLHVGQVLTFHKEAPRIYIVIIFDFTSTKVMTKCTDHGDTTRLVVMEEEV